MFRKEIEQNLGVIFGRKINQALDQTRLGGEIYYSINGDVKVVIKDGIGITFTVPIRLEIEIANPSEPLWGILTANLHDYDQLPKSKNFSVDDITTDEFESIIEKQLMRIGKDMSCIVKLDYNLVSEVIKEVRIKNE